jgi:riboflavin kinase/FMN adenylyltransferase
MEIEQELADVAPQKESLLTIGVFDGVHAGHRYLLSKLKERAAENNLLSGVVTFKPHPQSVLHPDEPLPWLSNLDDRVKAFQELGIDIVAVLTFTRKIAHLSAKDFMYLLKKHLKMKGIVVGPDFTLGRGQEGNITMLRALGAEMHFTVEVVHAFRINGEVVSSTRIRQALAQGDMREIKELLGHHFYLSGKVTTSERRGRTLGFPTANLDIEPQQALPDNGIYATITRVDGQRFPAATNVGTRPTFGEGKRMVETHLLGFKGDLYDKEIRVEFVQKVRDEQRFPSPEELKAQMGRDVQQVEAILRKEPGLLP